MSFAYFAYGFVIPLENAFQAHHVQPSDCYSCRYSAKPGFDAFLAPTPETIRKICKKPIAQQCPARRGVRWKRKRQTGGNYERD
jgi:hypothetical protein